MQQEANSSREVCRGQSVRLLGTGCVQLAKSKFVTFTYLTDDINDTQFPSLIPTYPVQSSPPTCLSVLKSLTRNHFDNNLPKFTLGLYIYIYSLR